MIQRRQRLIRKILAERCGEKINDLRFLEIGCGHGQWLTEFQVFGLREENMAGIDFDRERAVFAKSRFPMADIREGTAEALPWPDGSFDIVFQSTVFSSVLSEDSQRQIASEMKRVCRKGGVILWYDFTCNSPSNPNVKGVGKRQVRKLFEPWHCESQTVTLAPPLARRIVPFSWPAAELLETFCPFLRTHLISIITA